MRKKFFVNPTIICFVFLVVLGPAVADPVLPNQTFTAQLAGEGSVSPGGHAVFQAPLIELSSYGGITLDVGLSYDSGAGNGILGMGFSLTGLSMIKTCGDDAPLVMDDAAFTYCLDGKPLHRVEPRQPEVAADYFDASEYAVIGSANTRVWYHNSCDLDGFSGEACWVVENEAQQFFVYQALQNSPEGYFLMGVTDRFARFPIRIEWRVADACVDQGINSGGLPIEQLPVGPAKISWGGSGMGQVAWFEYECFRPDPYVTEKSLGNEDWSYGTMPEILKGVVFTDYSVPSGGVQYAWATRFDYGSGPVTERSRLETVRQCAYVADGLGDAARQLWQSSPEAAVDCKVETAFEWQDGQFGYEPAQSVLVAPINQMCRGPFLADFNRNGLPDLAYATDCSGGSNMQIQFKSPGSGFLPPVEVNVPADFEGLQLFDKNGDGQMGFISSTEGGLVFYDDHADGEFSVVEQDLIDSNKLHAFYVGDFNADGLGDVVTCQASTRQIKDWRDDAVHTINMGKEFVYYRNTGNTGGVGFEVSVRDLDDQAGLEQSGVRCLPGEVDVYNDSKGRARLVVEALKFLGTETGSGYRDRVGSGRLHVTDFDELKVSIVDITVPVGGDLTGQELLLKQLAFPKFRNVDLYGNSLPTFIGPSACDLSTGECDRRYGTTSLVASTSLMGRTNADVPLLGSAEAFGALSVGDLNMNGRDDLIFPFVGDLPNQCDLLPDWECPCAQAGQWASHTCADEGVASFYWAEYQPSQASWHIQAMPEQSVIVLSESGKDRILSKFRQDFNGDGLEDLLAPTANNRWQLFLHLPSQFDGAEVSGPADVVKKIRYGTGMIDEFEYANLMPSFTGDSSEHYDPDYEGGACAYPAYCQSTGGFRVVKSARYAVSDGPASAAFIHHHYSRLSHDAFAGTSLGFGQYTRSQVDWLGDQMSTHITRYNNGVHFYDMDSSKPFITSTHPEGVRGFPFAGQVAESWFSVADLVSGRKYVDYTFNGYETQASHRGSWPHHVTYADEQLERRWEFPITVAVDLSAPWEVAKANSAYLLSQSESAYAINRFQQRTSVEKSVWDVKRNETSRQEMKYFYLDEAAFGAPHTDVPNLWGDLMHSVQLMPPLRRTEELITAADGSQVRWHTTQEYEKKIELFHNWTGESLGAAEIPEYGYYRLASVHTHSPDDASTALDVLIEEHETCPLLAGSVIISGSGLDEPRTTVFEYERCRHTAAVDVPGYMHGEWEIYWPLEQVVSSHDDFGRRSDLEIDVWGRTTKVQHTGADGVLSGDWATTSYGRTIAGDWSVPTGLSIHEHSASGFDVLRKHNARYQVVYREHSGLNERVWQANTYDVRGRLISQGLPAKLGMAAPLERTFSYDGMGRVIQSDFDGHSTTRSYADQTVTFTNQAGHPTTKTFDALGRMRVLTDAHDTRFYYDYAASGLKLIRKNCETDCADDQVVHFASNPRGQVIYRMERGGSGVSERFYNALGEVTGTFDEAQLLTSIERDGLGRVVQVDGLNGTDQFIYEPLNADGIGQQAPPGALTQSISASGVSRHYQYEPSMGRLIGERLEVGDEVFFTGYRHDALGRLDELHYPVKVPESGGIPTAPVQLKYHYAAGSGRMLQVDRINPSSGALSMLWRLEAENANASPIQVEYGNQLHTVSTHYPTGQLQGRRTGMSEFATVDMIQDLSLSYWETGAVKERNHFLHHTDDGQYLLNAFEYDALNRLQGERREAWESDPTANLTLTHEFTEHLTYDVFGNIEEIPGTGSFSSTPAGQMLTFNGLPAAQVYDAKGRLSIDDNRAISWNQHNKPASITSDDEHHQFQYDATGQRVLKVSAVGEQSSVQVEVGQLYRRLQSDTLEHVFSVFAGGSQVGVIKYVGQLPDHDVLGAVDDSFQVHYFHVDDQGTPNVVSDASGQLVSARYYSAWGDVLSEHNWGEDWFGQNGYTNHAAQLETDLQYMKGRHYNPRYRRFVSPDPYVVGGLTAGYNRYSYVYNNPSTLTDPSGYFAQGPDVGAEGDWMQYCSDDSMGCGWGGDVPQPTAAPVVLFGGSVGQEAPQQQVHVQAPVGNPERKQKNIKPRDNRQYENEGVVPSAMNRAALDEWRGNPLLRPAPRTTELDSLYDNPSYGRLQPMSSFYEAELRPGHSAYFSPREDRSGYLIALNPGVVVMGAYGLASTGRALFLGGKKLYDKVKNYKFRSKPEVSKPSEPKPSEPKPSEPKPSEPKPSQPQPLVKITEAIGQSQGLAANNHDYDDVIQKSIQVFLPGAFGGSKPVAPVPPRVIHELLGKGADGVTLTPEELNQLELYKEYFRNLVWGD